MLSLHGKMFLHVSSLNRSTSDSHSHVERDNNILISVDKKGKEILLPAAMDT